MNPCKIGKRTLGRKRHVPGKGAYQGQAPSYNGRKLSIPLVAVDARPRRNWGVCSREERGSFQNLTRKSSQLRTEPGNVLTRVKKNRRIEQQKREGHLEIPGKKSHLIGRAKKLAKQPGQLGFCNKVQRGKGQ